MANRDPVVPGPEEPQQRTPLQWTPLATVSREERALIASARCSQTTGMGREKRQSQGRQVAWEGQGLLQGPKKTKQVSRRVVMELPQHPSRIRPALQTSHSRTSPAHQGGSQSQTQSRTVVGAHTSPQPGPEAPRELRAHISLQVRILVCKHCPTKFL